MQLGFTVQLVALLADTVEASEFGFVVDAEAAELREAALLQVARVCRLRDEDQDAEEDEKRGEAHFGHFEASGRGFGVRESSILSKELIARNN